MATKSVAWTTGTGNILLTYQGQGDGPINISSDENNLGSARSQNVTIKTTDNTKSKIITINQAANPFPVGTIKNYSYSGSVQEVTLIPGSYKLQAWGAQGGNITGSYTATGSKGGYSEGVLTITSPTIVRIFVGGKGADVSTSASAAAQNGGWNGGGGTYKKGAYSSGTKSARCYVAPGGGASDICLVTSSMSYSNLRNNRSAASLLSRFLVAGGGGGAAVEIVDEQKTRQEDIPVSGTKYTGIILDGGSSNTDTRVSHYEYSVDPSKTYKVKGFGVPSSSWSGFHLVIYYNGSTILGYYLLSQHTTTTYVSTYYTLNLPSNCNKVVINTHNNYTPTFVYEGEVSYTDTTVYQSSGISYGGGVESGGPSPMYKAYQDASAYTEFGLGKNQTETGVIGGGGAGAGWYGGATNNAHDFDNNTNVSGGGSGFVNTAASASHRPSGYTGLQLDSGETKAGNTTFKAPGGSNETGHSGDGYIRITRLS